MTLNPTSVTTFTTTGSFIDLGYTAHFKIIIYYTSYNKVHNIFDSRLAEHFIDVFPSEQCLCRE